MADLSDDTPALPVAGPAARRAGHGAVGVGYSLAILCVVAAAVLAFVAEELIAPPNLSLIFVAPVVIAAAAFGLGPALAAGVAGVVVFDFFFLSPRYTLRVGSSADIWALALLAVIAVIVSTLGAQARGRGRATDRAAENLKTLQHLAEAAATRPSMAELGQATAAALHQIFDAPVVIFVRRGVSLAPLAMAGSPNVTDAARAAAQWALGSAIVVHAQIYPHDTSNFDFWPLGAGLVVGVDFTAAEEPRPTTAGSMVALAAAHLVQASGVRNGATTAS